MFNGYITKILNNNEIKIFYNYLQKYRSTINIPLSILYMPNIQINENNLINSEYIYFIDYGETIFKLLHNDNAICKHIVYDHEYNKIRCFYTLAYHPTTKHVLSQTKQRLQDTFTILYHIFTQHYDVYLPELSKYIFLLYFDVIYDLKN